MAIQLRRGTKTEFDSYKTYLVTGEPCVTTDTDDLYFKGTNVTRCLTSSAQTLDSTEQAQVWSNLGGDGASGYAKFPDGTMVQWGTEEITATFSQVASSGIYWSGTQTITFPQAFASSSFTISGSSRYSTGHVLPIGAVPASTTTATVCAYDFYARTSTTVYWQAVGRWK